MENTIKLVDDVIKRQTVGEVKCPFTSLLLLQAVPQVSLLKYYLFYFKNSLQEDRRIVRLGGIVVLVSTS